MIRRLFALLILGLFPVFTGFGARLILKLKPEQRFAIDSRTSPFYIWWASLKLPVPEKRFPNHPPLTQGKTFLGKPLIDLSLMYEAEIPESYKTAFLLRQINQRAELEYAEWEESDAVPLAVPNDPQADSLTGSQRQVLKVIEAYLGWAVSQGDTQVVIGILDTGIPVDHEDLRSQVKINPLDPPNGVDDDQNGLVDDYRGWDFGSNDSNPTPDNTGTSPGHGTSVAGIAGASSDNSLGVAGIGWKCKILPLKIWRWNGSFSNFKGYDAIVYAADRGCKIINCSWGSPRTNRQYEQDIIQYATFNKGALVVAAGGNTPGYFNFLPANYDYVLGVTMTDTTDRIFWAASLNSRLDMMAPGINVSGIRTDGTYGWVEGGSSMASPQVAGAAGLVASRFPELTGLQIGELLRVNSDTVYSKPGNEIFRDLAGKGRLNVYKTLLRQNSVSLRATDFQIRNAFGKETKAGDTVQISFRFENYLDSVPGFTARLYSSSPLLEILEAEKSFGPISTLEGRWENTSFRAVISTSFTTAAQIRIRIDVKAGTYSDRQVFFYWLDPGTLELDANQVRIGFPSNGRWGFPDGSNQTGAGIRYRNVQNCGDAGLMIGTGPDRVSNCVYDTLAIDQHFRTEGLSRFTLYEPLDQHAVAYLNDSAAGSRALGLGIKVSAYEQTLDSLSGTVFLSYQITNRTSDTLDSLCIAQYNDWEVENLNANRAAWVDSLDLGYTTGSAFRTRYAATQVLGTGESQFYAIDALPLTTNGNLNLFDGFSLAEKWKAMSSGIGRSQAGLAGQGNNVVQVAGMKLRSIEPGGVRKVGFAYVFADSLPELIRKGKATRNAFRVWNTSSSPGGTHHFCIGDTVTISSSLPQWLNNLTVYSDSLSDTPIHQGPGFEATVFSDSAFFISGADSLFPGPRMKWFWKSRPRPEVSYQVLPAATGDSLILNQGYSFSAAREAGFGYGYWIVTRNGTSDTLEGSEGTDSLLNQIFTDIGLYSVCLFQRDSLTGCRSTYCRDFTVYLPTGISDPFSRMKLFPNPAQSSFRIQAQVPVGVKLQDLSGRILWEKRLDSGGGPVSLEGLPKGFYLVEVRGAGLRKVFRLMKE